MEVLVCPLGHQGSVVRASWYGRAGQRRQRWLCRSADAEAHRFAEVLPRIVDGVAGHVCQDCATHLEPWEGQPAPRLYGFAARHVARALALVAAGGSYRSTAEAIRALASRELSTNPRLGRHGRGLPAAYRHGQLISDWVEVFAPLIWSAYASASWPEQVAADEAEFRHGRVGRPRGDKAFSVLAVVGDGGVAVRAATSTWAAITASSPSSCRPSDVSGTWPATSPTPCPPRWQAIPATRFTN